MPEVWTVDDLVYGALAEVGRSTERVNVSVPADTPPVLVDAVQVRQILSQPDRQRAQVLAAGEPGHACA